MDENSGDAGTLVQLEGDQHAWTRAVLPDICHVIAHESQCTSSVSSNPKGLSVLACLKLICRSALGYGKPVGSPNLALKGGIGMRGC